MRNVATVVFLAEVLRDAAQIPRAAGVAIVGVRAAAEDARRGGEVT